MRISENIYYNINESDIFVNYLGFEFYFSSDFNKKRFTERVNSYIINETMKLNCRYKISSDFSRFLSISFYKQIEKRGFRIEKSGVKISKENIVIGDIIYERDRRNQVD